MAGRPGTRRLPPGRNAGWLTPEVWQEFPDPLPDVISNPATDMPSGDVRPDENLRRLWLVRAHLTVHLNTGERMIMGALLAMFFLLWPFTSSLLTYTEGFSLVSRRKQALQLEETRLMALDAMRPGGPIGGPAVQAGELPYVPPSLEAYRPTGSDESR